jgi:hypothetical protein
MKTARKLFGALLLITLLGLVISMPSDLTETAQRMGQRGPDGINLLVGANQGKPDAEHWVSEPVNPVHTLAARDLPYEEPLPTLDREINPRMNFGPQPETDFDPPNQPDPLLALQAGVQAVQDTGFATPIFNFNGQGYSGVNPPDTVGAVGKDHYIQMINATRVAIYDKLTGELVIPPFNLSALGGCATGSGDPIVLYDQLADRWFLSEFGAGNSLCTYVSQTPNPTGAYYSYQFSTPSFPDYPKYGVWPDAYYATTNESSPAIYAFNRAAMLAGNAATSQRFTAPGLAGFGFEALTPADLDGMTPPPAGSPNYIMRQVDTEAHSIPGFPANDILEIWAFSVNWTTPANSTFVKIADILTAEFDSTLCGLTSFFCMGMPGVAQGASNSLDPLREVIMNRLAYRNFGTHEVLVGNFVTDIGSNIGGKRWFELRKVGAGAWTLHQEGTYAPTTSDNRWMGGISMDGAGNIALAYNVSSQTIYPSIRYTGRLSTDPLGTMPQGEYTLVNGSAINGSNRYGDYSAMSIDPIDDCTFWFTGQWNDATQWKTRIGALRFDACGETNFTMNVTPVSQQVCVPANATYNVALAAVSDFTGGVNLSAVGNPGTASFSSNPTTPPGSSVLTLSGVAAGAYSFDVFGSSVITPTLVQSQTVSLEAVATAPGTPTLLTPTNGALNVPAMPTFTWNATSGAGSYSIQVATDSGFNNIVASASGLIDPTWTANVALNTSTTHYWRVQANNACGVGSYSAVRSFTTLAAPGDCGPGTTANIIYDYGFESGASGWTTPAGTGTNTWAISALNPFTGVNHYRGAGTAAVTDQRLVSPAVALPAGQNPVVLKFQHVPNLENSTTGCFDAGILEVSANGGSTWTQVPNAALLVGGYTGLISSSYSNPLSGLQGWCSPSTTTYQPVVADVSSYAGQTVQFRWRIGTDTSVSRPGWDLDNVTVQSCQAGFNATVTPMSDETVLPGATAVHHFTLTNLGLNDTYDLILSGGDWPTTLQTSSSLAVSGGMTATISVSVETPLLLGSDTFTVTATSQANPGLVLTAVGTTTTSVNAGLMGSGDSELWGLSGLTTTHTITVTNTGNFTDTFAVEVLTGNEWNTWADEPTTGSLAPGESATVMIHVLLGVGTVSADTAIVRVSSGWDNALYEDVSLTTKTNLVFVPMFFR